MRFDFPQVYRAYLACRRKKRNKPSALAFELNHEESLVELAVELRERRYQPGVSICFYTKKPKAREIFAAAFRDRIVHHLIYAVLAPVWERVFIQHSYACRPGKGTHAAAQALQRFLRQLTANGTRRAYYLKLDVKNFFMTIDRRKLFEMLAARCHDPELLWLLRVVVFHDPTSNYEMQDRDNLRRALPPHKSLFHAQPFCGLPIGNLTSQFFANVYLNALDQFVKHELKCRYYLRFVDDFVLLAESLEQLREWQAAITAFLAEKLALALNPRATRLAPVSGGVDFAGFIVRPHYMLVRRRVLGNLKAKLRMARRQLIVRATTYCAYRFHEETLADCRAALNSYLGHFRHAQTRRCVKKLWQEFSWLERFFVLSSRKVTRRDEPLRRKPRLNAQVHWERRNFKKHVVLVQLGCYYEAFNTSAEVLAKALNLHLKQNWRGFACACGFPQKMLLPMLAELKKQRVPLVLLRETGREGRHAKQRALHLILEYPELIPPAPLS